MALVRSISEERVISVADYVAARQRIGYSQARACADGLCCFLEDSAAVTKPRTSDKVLVVAHLAANVDLEGIIKPDGSLGVDHPNYRDQVTITITKLRPACSELRFSYQIVDGRLIWQSGCNIHEEKRDEVCERYPRGEKIGCLYVLNDQFSLGKCNARFDGPTEVYFMGFKEPASDDLRPFSFGTLELNDISYLMIPIPPGCAIVPQELFSL